MATLSAFRHVVSSASGCQASKGNLVDEKPQFVLSSSMRALSPMRIPSATGYVSAIPSQPNCNNRCERVMGRPKQVTDPLNELVRARLCGNCETSAINTNYCSSGSDHGPNSERLADMVYGFMEEDDDEAAEGKANNEVDGSSNSNVGEDIDSNAFSCENVKDILQGLVFPRIDSNGVEDLLYKEAIRAVEICKVNQDVVQNCNGYRNSNESSYEMKHKSLLRRCVMNRLREVGYNAGVCKPRWEQHTDGFPARDYEYIDVIIDGKERFIVDIDFRVEFEIARPTCQYNVLVQILPEIFVGKGDRLKQIIKIMSDSAKKSLKKKGMHFPPWRKYPYMQTKWLGPYKRTTNAVSGSNHCSSNELKGREIGSIALKGSGWDHGIKHQMELHYEKAMREDIKSKTKLPKFQTKCGSEMSKEWMPPSVIRAERGGKVSALASAFKENSFTCFSTVDNAQQA